ncbi:MAG: glyceraldehyde 3-phosphate dehydrogenase [Flavobacteriales bacterium]|jgi:glyceraldehyde 3-phosphate dehydrogenase
MKIAINGFGRIGRNFIRAAVNMGELSNVVAVNDLTDINTMAHLLKYDSVHGKFKGTVTVIDDKIVVNGTPILYLSEKNPTLLPWNTLQVDVVIESTGIFTSLDGAQKHIEAGAKKVIISAPSSSEEIPSLVMGVNDHEIDFTSPIISNASCTTNSAAPLIKVLDDLCGIESGYITTVHSYTGDQTLHDTPHKDLRRARAGAVSIIPTTTGAAKAITKIFPKFDGKIGGCGIRVPVPDGSLTDITCVVTKPVSIEAINNAFQEASKQVNFKGILEYIDEPIVSVDVLGNTHSCVFDSLLTSSLGNMVKVVGWYDNEVGYAHRLVDVLSKLIFK